MEVIYSSMFISVWEINRDVDMCSHTTCTYDKKILSMGVVVYILLGFLILNIVAV